ncbi:transcriptional-regulating factor 1-like [Rhinatrema bivittatum]|uniref:transcriptional-regulating factor 1-like n=1 Tax=Rhinatrema bivittatum TaxID=194408 RepID=UPI00112929AF|nr:transcriptional-regulating factor 1-like [Rhinatrema bivittatum]
MAAAAAAGRVGCSGPGVSGASLKAEDVQKHCSTPDIRSVDLSVTSGSCHQGSTIDNNTNKDLGFEPKLLHMANVTGIQVILKPITSYYTGVPFQSCLRSTRFWDDSPGMVRRYTPQPMLDPLRKGSGLFSNLVHGSGTDCAQQPPLQLTDVTDYTQDKDSPSPLAVLTPQINVGADFQVALPELQDFALARADPPQAELAWRPSEELQQDPGTQCKVESLLNMACSSAFPGGGTNQELALHCLFEANGDTLAALELLLLKMPSRPRSHPLADYHYTGSDIWLPQEHHLFNKAFSMYKKDFYKIQQMVQSKKLRQCVEYYYLYKKELKLARKQNGSYKDKGLVSQEQRLSCLQTSDLQLGDRLGAACTASTSRSFPCKQCGKVFYKIKSRNAHMKIHRPQEPVVPPVPSLPPILFSSYPLESALDKAPGTVYSPWSSREEGPQQYDPIADALSCPGLVPLYMNYTKDKFFV